MYAYREKFIKKPVEKEPAENIGDALIGGKEFVRKRLERMKKSELHKIAKKDNIDFRTWWGNTKIIDAILGVDADDSDSGTDQKSEEDQD